MNNLSTPPAAPEIEQSLIAAIMLSQDAASEILENVSPNDFYRAAHQEIIKTAQDLHRVGDPLDVTYLTETLRTRGRLEKIGGGSYLAKILDEPIPSNIEKYCTIVQEKAALRRLIQVSQKTIQAAHEGYNTDEIIDTAQSEILKISTDDRGQVAQIDPLLDQAISRYEALYKTQGELIGIPSGFPDMDLLTAGFGSGDLIILAARPSMGKSALMVSIAAHLGLHDIPCGVFSLEMSKEQLVDRLAAVTGRVNSIKFRNGKFIDEDWQKITNAFGKLAGKPVHLNDSADSKFSSLRKRARQMVKQGVKVIFIDYLQLISGGTRENRNLEISEITRGLKLLAKDLEIPIVLLSQLSRKCEERNNKRPLLSDLRDSGAIEQDADVVMFLYREEAYVQTDENRGFAELIIAKQRNGPTGAINLHWNAATTRFDSYAQANN